MTEHTPTPWRGWDCLKEFGKDEYPEPHPGDIRIVGDNNVCIGVVFGGYASLPEADANSAYIVKACNAFPKLIAVLENVRQLSDCKLSRQMAEDVLRDVKGASNHG
jgi:hypothetical protein